MSAYLDFIETGGRFCYLGGNGYYWCTVSDVQRPHRLELRRAGLGSGSFLLPAGEGHHQLTGEFGGVWSQRGFPAAKFTGLMAAAVGIGKGAAYGVVEKERTNPKIAFVLKGLENDKVIGDYGLLAEAASGDELDRVNYDMGSSELGCHCQHETYRWPLGQLSRRRRRYGVSLGRVSGDESGSCSQ